MAASALAHHTTTANVTPEKGVQLYFQYLDALVAEDDKR